MVGGGTGDGGTGDGGTGDGGTGDGGTGDGGTGDGGTGDGGTGDGGTGDGGHGDSGSSLGAFIRAQRQTADLSLRRMAELAQVSNAYLSQVERGLHQPSVRVLRSIADALNISAETLLAHAGLMDAAARAADRPAAQDAAESSKSTSTSRDSATESAIRNDPSLLPEDRDALIRIYRSLRRARSV